MRSNSTIWRGRVRLSSGVRGTLPCRKRTAAGSTFGSGFVRCNSHERLIPSLWLRWANAERNLASPPALTHFLQIFVDLGFHGQKPADDGFWRGAVESLPCSLLVRCQLQHRAESSVLI